MAESAFARRQREMAAARKALVAFALGMPSLVVAAACLVACTLAMRQESESHNRIRYIKAGRQAVERENWAAGEMIGRKLVDLRPDDPTGRYLIALCADAQGETERAWRLMTQIAPRTAPGFAPAQWWLVCKLSRQSRQAGIQTVEEIRDRLRQFVILERDHAQAHMMLGQSELALANIDDALAQMDRAADLAPAYHLTVARVAARMGRTAPARSHAERAGFWLKRPIEQSPEDIDARLHWVDALAMTGEFRRAEEVLLEGLQLDPDPRLAGRLVQLSVTAFDVISQQPTRLQQGVRQQLAILERALAMAPQHEGLLKRLAMLSIDPLDTERKAAALLQPTLDAGTAPLAVRMVLGNDALQREDFVAAREHLEAAHRLEPGFSVCLNNLALALAQSEEAELERALSLADAAVQAEPDRPEFRETRGQILVKLERYEEAIPELREGLKSPGPIWQTHAVLADAYDAVGETQQAAYYRSQQ
jgi:tetratricopeptide (TPR) repeat protein